VLVKCTQRSNRVTVMLVIVSALAAAGCQPQPVEWPELGTELEQQGYREIRVEAQANQEAAELSPDDIIAVMEKIGFTPEQILDFGPPMYKALRQSGGARVMVGKKTEAILRVKGHLLFIRSKSRGSFIYDLERSRFGLM